MTLFICPDFSHETSLQLGGGAVHPWLASPVAHTLRIVAAGGNIAAQTLQIVVDAASMVLIPQMIIAYSHSLVVSVKIRQIGTAAALTHQIGTAAALALLGL